MMENVSIIELLSRQIEILNSIKWGLIVLILLVFVNTINKWGKQ